MAAVIFEKFRKTNGIILFCRECLEKVVAGFEFLLLLFEVVTGHFEWIFHFTFFLGDWLWRFEHHFVDRFLGVIRHVLGRVIVGFFRHAALLDKFTPFEVSSTPLQLADLIVSLPVELIDHPHEVFDLLFEEFLVARLSVFGAECAALRDWFDVGEAVLADKLSGVRHQIPEQALAIARGQSALEKERGYLLTELSGVLGHEFLELIGVNHIFQQINHRLLQSIKDPHHVRVRPKLTIKRVLRHLLQRLHIHLTHNTFLEKIVHYPQVLGRFKALRHLLQVSEETMPILVYCRIVNCRFQSSKWQYLFNCIFHDFFFYFNTIVFFLVKLFRHLFFIFDSAFIRWAGITQVNGFTVWVVD